MRDVRQLRLPWPDFEFSTAGVPFPVEAIPPPLSYPGPVYLRIPERGTALVSDAIDRSLARGGLASELAGQPYRLPGPLRPAHPTCWRPATPGAWSSRRRGRDAGRPAATGSGAGAPVGLHRAGFFDAQCSNDLCTLRITHRGTGREFDPRRALLTTADGHLRTLADSELADAVGVSTLAMTADGAAVLITQSPRNAASPGLLAPSGSGSLDPGDLGRGRTGILQDILRRGMQRELCEETGIQPGEIRSTIVVGFARWLERGAKPEFFGLTELSATTADLAGRRPRGCDRLYSGAALTLRIDLDALGRELAEGAELLTAPGLPRRIREDGALPLLLAVRAAASWRAGTAAGDHAPR